METCPYFEAAVRFRMNRNPAVRTNEHPPERLKKVLGLLRT
jgi:hypothetical protein